MNRVKLVNVTFLVTILIYLGGNILMSSLLTEPLPLAANVFITEGMVLIPTFLFLLVARENPFKILRIKKIKIGTLLLLPVFAACIMPFMTLLNAFSLLFTENQVLGVTQNLPETVPYVVGMLIMAVAPAVVEETVYRGVFYSEYSRVSSLGAVILSGFLFGLMHMNLNQFVYAFAMGCIFAILVETTGSLVSSMVVHFCINGFSTSLVYVFSLFGDSLGSMTELAEQTAITGTTLLALAATAIVPTALAVLFLVIMSRIEGRTANLLSIVKREKRGNLLSIPLLIGIAFCIGYITLALLVEHGVIVLN